MKKLMLSLNEDFIKNFPEIYSKPNKVNKYLKKYSDHIEKDIKNNNKVNKTELSKIVAEKLAKKAQEKKITKIFKNTKMTLILKSDSTLALKMARNFQINNPRI